MGARLGGGGGGGRKLLVHCDNHAVVDIWSSGTSRSPELMVLVRRLFFVAAIKP